MGLLQKQNLYSQKPQEEGEQPVGLLEGPEVCFHVRGSMCVYVYRRLPIAPKHH